MKVELREEVGSDIIEVRQVKEKSTMKVTIGKKELIAALKKVKPVILRKSILPILQNILLQADSDKLTITGTDLDNTIQVKIDAGIDTAGQCTVNNKRFVDTINFIAGAFITLEFTGDDLSIKAGPVENQSGFSIKADPADDFPTISFPECPDDPAVTMLLSDKMVNKARTACNFVSDEMQRPPLKGVFFEFTSTTTIITATDGHYLSTCTMPIYGTGAGHNSIVPIFPLIQIDKAKKEKWFMYIHDKKVIFSAGDHFKIMSKTIDGPYPNYKQVIPKDCANEMTVDRETLLVANNMLLAYSDKETHLIRYDFNDALDLSAGDVDTGAQGKQKINSGAYKYHGQNQAIGYNGQLVKTILESMQDKNVIWRTDSPKSAAMIYPGDISENNKKFLLMPLRLND